MVTALDEVWDDLVKVFPPLPCVGILQLLTNILRTTPNLRSGVIKLSLSTMTYMTLLLGLLQLVTTHFGQAKTQTETLKTVKYCHWHPG